MKLKVCVVITCGARVLLLERGAARRHEWQPVTGHVDDGEKPRAAALREIAEETGFDSGDLRATGLVVRFAHDATAFEEHVYAYELASEDAPALSHEHVAFAWLTREEALARVAYEGQRDAISAASPPA